MINDLRMAKVVFIVHDTSRTAQRNSFAQQIKAVTTINVVALHSGFETVEASIFQLKSPTLKVLDLFNPCSVPFAFSFTRSSSLSRHVGDSSGL